MGIEKIRNNFEGSSSSKFAAGNSLKNRVFLGEIKDSTSFTGAASVAGDAVKPVKEIILEIMPKTAKRLVKMHEGMGEIQNQLINAVGTGLIAPLFIKFNPLSDTDENTRTYTAWRQPVSAVLAVCTQCAIVKPFNSIIERMADIGYLGQKYNSTLFPSENHIKKLIKEQNPDKKFTKDELKAEIKKFKASKEKELKEMIENDKIIFNKTDLKGVSTFEMENKDFKKLFTETLDSIIKAEEKERINAIEKKFPLKIERNVFYHNHPEESRAVLQRISNKITQSYSQSDVTADRVAEASKELNKEFKTIITELKAEIKANPEKKSVNSELIKIVTDLKNKNTDKDASALRVLNSKVDHMIESVNIMSSKKTTQEIIEYVGQNIYERTNAIDEIISTLAHIKDKVASSGITVKEAQQIIDEKITKSETHIWTMLKAKGLSEKEILESCELNGSLASRFKQKAGSIATCIAEQMKKHTKSNIDGYKRWTGLGVSLAILPVTCWLLNKIYPWFMDLAFPKLSNKKQQAKKDSVEIQNDKKAEVK